MKSKLLLLPVLLAGLLAGCGNQPSPGPTPDPDPTVHVNYIELSSQGHSLSVGEKFAISYVITPTNATNKEVTWSSTDESVAKYSDGFINAYKVGETKITVTTVDGGLSDECFIQVFDEEIINVESISISDEEINLEIGQSKTLSFTILPENATNKTVKWLSDDSSIATVENGVVKAKNAGTTVVSVISNDGFKVANCNVTVSEPVTPPTPDPDETKTSTLNASKFADKETAPLNTTVDYITFNFEKGEGTYNPGYYTGKGGFFKIYKGNTLTISSSKGNISQINFTYNTDKDTKNMKLLSDVGTVSEDLSKWTGDSKTIVFTTENIDGGKCFSTISVTYSISAHHPAIDLGVKTVKEVKEYIVQAVEDEVFDVNQYGMGVDPYTTVTIKGLAMAKLHLSKSTASHGYNITEPNKVVIGDDTDSIAVASKTGDGTLYDKVNSYQMKSDSKYSVKGYISMNLGTPELICTSYEWDKSQSETANVDKISKGEITLSEFYEKANAVNYNISGFGYGETYTIKGLTCYYSETGGSGKTWYNFTDGTRNIRVNAYNVSGATVGLTYDVTGIISMESYSPIIIGYKFSKSQEEPVDLNEFYKCAEEMSIKDLKKINYINDTDKKYPGMINNYSKIYKLTGYLTIVQENQEANLYIGISDTFVDVPLPKGDRFISGKGASSTSSLFDLSLIKNEKFWNFSDKDFQLNPYNEYINENVPVTVYYTPRQTAFYNGKMYWEILLIPQSMPVSAEA